MKFAIVDVCCYKCDNVFEVRVKGYPIQEEVTVEQEAVCPFCKAECGYVRVGLSLDSWGSKND